MNQQGNEAGRWEFYPAAYALRIAAPLAMFGLILFGVMA